MNVITSYCNETSGHDQAKELQQYMQPALPNHTQQAKLFALEVHSSMREGHVQVLPVDPNVGVSFFIN